MGQARDKCTVKISRIDIIRLHFVSLLVAVWFIAGKVLKMLWKRDKNSGGLRDKPLTCLVDNTLGYHSYVKLQGIKLHYVEVGNPNSPLALLLHGFPDCWLGWRHQMKVLSSHFRVVAVDLKGFGDSDKPIWRTNYKIGILMNEIHELIVSLQANKCVLIGHDIGAHLGWYFVTQYPEIVHKFVAISCPHPNVFWDYAFMTGSRFNSKWIHLCQVPLLPEIEAGSNDLSIIDEFYKHLSLQREENLVEAYKYSFSRTEDWTGPINYYRNLPFCRIREGKEVTVPTLLIIGNRDPFIPLESIVKSTEYISKYVLKIVKNGTHFPHQENPDHVNNLLLQFLTVPKEKTESTNSTMGLMGSLYTNTVKYGNSLVDGVKKTTNGVVRLPSQMLKHSS